MIEFKKNAQELMSQSSLFYATAFAYALNRFDPSSMGRPSISAFSSGDGGNKSGGRDKKRLRSDDKGEWASLMSRRNAKACGDYQRKDARVVLLASTCTSVSGAVRKAMGVLTAQVRTRRIPQ